MSGQVAAFGNILLGGIFHAAVLFLVAAGLQLVFGVQKIVNLACGSFYALGAYFGISAVNWALKLGLPPQLFQDVLRFFWGANPQQLGGLVMSYGKLSAGGVIVPTYNMLVILASIVIAAG